MSSTRRSPFLLGAASIFDFAGNLRPKRRSEGDLHEAATEALANGWLTVGDALRTAMGQFPGSTR